MKKLILLSLFVLSALQCLSQSLTTTSPVSSGSIFTVTANGETTTAYFSSITLDPTLTTTSSPNINLQTWISASSLQFNFYNLVSQQPTTFTLSVTNNYNAPITVTLGFRCVVVNSQVGVSSSDVKKYLTLTVNPVYYNTAKSGMFTKNNCATGGTPSTVTYTVPANTYSSLISQADADSKATNNLNTNGQTFANTNGTCTFFSAAQSGNFTQSFCATGTPDVIAYSIPAGTYTSIISQSDANNKAINALAIQGQNYADANGTCGGTKPVITLTNTSSKAISIRYSIPNGSWYVKITVRDNATGITTSSTQSPGVNTISVPTSLNTYTVTLTIYSSTYPSGTSSSPKDIYVTF